MTNDPFDLDGEFDAIGIYATAAVIIGTLIFAVIGIGAVVSWLL
jgi:hypothetical protein